MIGETVGELSVIPENISPKIVRLGKASVEMGELIRKNCISERNITPANIPTAEIICRDGIDLNPELSLDEILKKAGEIRADGKKMRVGLYNTGISKGVEGNEVQTQVPLSKKEMMLMKVGQLLEKGVRAQIIPEENFENKETAADFLIEEGLDIVIMVVPTPDNIYSSLAVDALSRGTVLGKLKEVAIHPEIYAFSNGGFKEFQIHFAGFTAILDDLRFALSNGMLPGFTDVSEVTSVDTIRLEQILLEVKRQAISDLDQPDYQDAGKREHLWKKTFTSGYDALQYLAVQRDSDIFIGSSPVNVDELAIIPAYHPLLLRRCLQDLGRLLINKSIRAIALNEHNVLIDTILSGNYLTGNIELFISRLLEIGRAKSLNKGDIDSSDIAVSITRKLMESSLGRGKVIYLADRSGLAVDTASGGITRGESLIFGENHTLFVETHPEWDFMENGGVPSVHEEIKRDMAVTSLQAFSACDQLGLLDNTGNRIIGRYIPTGNEAIGKDNRGVILRHPKRFRDDRYRELIGIKSTLTDTEQELLTKVELAYNKLFRVVN